ncbi:DUF547 domain-containing protein [Hymenobacter rubripertinctus]|uniref:DUF547 domain-containing protein n=1 Tax=Hymenobacter rubripertinctus TaxID=2029981 RepID=A0A418QTS2_9BACT|nr:DUF547 domain-containing protein [Hymenobacter rubripertinctus]RIY08400.1 DUF547 domain-containing protein [Hymenobacter rubripertinctus]
MRSHLIVLPRPLVLLVGFLLLMAASGRAAQSQPAVHMQQPWSTLLRHHVTPDGRLDYEGLLEEEDVLYNYLQSLRKIKPAEQGWTADDTKAFWLNTYNAAATNLVLENYPIASINDIRVKVVGGYKSPWEAPVVNVGGQSYSLNQIEREILRDQYQDARVHFALMYGAASQAPILAEAYDGSRLSQQLDEQTRRFLNDSAFNQLTPQHAQVSALFQSYAAEFGSEAQIIDFINRYVSVPVLPTANVEYLSFSWALNNRTGLGTSQALGRH